VIRAAERRGGVREIETRIVKSVDSLVGALQLLRELESRHRTVQFLEPHGFVSPEVSVARTLGIVTREAPPDGTEASKRLSDVLALADAIRVSGRTVTIVRPRDADKLAKRLEDIARVALVESRENERRSVYAMTSVA